MSVADLAIYNELQNVVSVLKMAESKSNPMFSETLEPVLESKYPAVFRWYRIISMNPVVRYYQLEMENEYLKTIQRGIL